MLFHLLFGRLWNSYFFTWLFYAYEGFGLRFTQFFFLIEQRKSLRFASVRRDVKIYDFFLQNNELNEWQL